MGPTLLGLPLLQLCNMDGMLGPLCFGREHKDKIPLLFGGLLGSMGGSHLFGVGDGLLGGWPHQH